MTIPTSTTEKARSSQAGNGIAASTVTNHAQRATNRLRRSTHISKQQGKNLIEALAFAEASNLRLNVSVDICWTLFAGIADDNVRLARLQERLSKWAKRRGFPLAMIWVREVNEFGSPNTHILLHADPWLAEDEHFFRSVLEQELEPEGGPTCEQAIWIQPAYDPVGKLEYMLKGLTQEDATALGLSIEASPQGVIEGKRVGCTQNIAQSARIGSHSYWIRESTQSSTETPTYISSKSQEKFVSAADLIPNAASKFDEGSRWTRSDPEAPRLTNNISPATDSSVSASFSPNHISK